MGTRTSRGGRKSGATRAAAGGGAGERMPDSERWPAGFKSRADWEASPEFKKKMETEAADKAFAEKARAELTGKKKGSPDESAKVKLPPTMSAMTSREAGLDTLTKVGPAIPANKVTSGTAVFEFSHGKKPSGTNGSWAFDLHSTRPYSGTAQGKATLFVGGGQKTLSAAKKEAAKIAGELGYPHIEVAP